MYFHFILRLCVKFIYNKKNIKRTAEAVLICRLLSVKRHAVGALLGSGIGLMGTHHDLIQRAVVLRTAMILALVDGALNVVVSTARMVHSYILL